jgi:hypothetical protein
MKLSLYTAAGCIALALVTLPAYSQNALLNGDFSAGGGPTSFTGLGGGGSSAANDWPVWNNTLGTTTTALAPGAIHITTGGEDDGIYQYLSGATYAAGAARADFWMYIVSGEAAFLVGNNGSGYTFLTDSTPGSWVHVSGTSSYYTNEVAFYSFPGAADFYVADASLLPINQAYTAPKPTFNPGGGGVPEPGAYALITSLGLAGGAFLRRRRAR